MPKGPISNQFKGFGDSVRIKLLISAPYRSLIDL